MPESLTFYFDYISPYAYLAHHRLGEFCTAHGLECRLEPILFAAALDRWGHRGPAEIEPKRVATFRDVARKSAMMGIPMLGPPAHPFNPLAALRASLTSVAGDAQAALVTELYTACWGRGQALTDPATIAAAARAVGLDPETLEARIAEPEVKAELKRRTSAALDAGVFGVPTFHVRGEHFWGVDQYPVLERILAGDDPLPGDAWARFADIRPQSVRPGSRTG